MKFTFGIPGSLPGLNELIAAAKSGHGAGNRYRKLKAASELAIFYAIKQANVPPFVGSVYVNFRWIAPNKKRDPDNISAAKKLILDSLQKSGVLQGDGWRHISGLSDTFEIDKNNPCVIVTIEDT